MPNDHEEKIAAIIEREVLRQTPVPYGGVDWMEIGRAVYREMITDKAVDALLGPGDRIRIDVPLTNRCQCSDDRKIVRHEFGRGSRCMTCGMPA